MTWLREEAPGATPLDRVFGLRAGAHARFRELLDALHAHFDDAQLATLTLAVAMYDALARFTVALEV